MTNPVIRSIEIYKDPNGDFELGGINYVRRFSPEEREEEIMASLGRDIVWAFNQFKEESGRAPTSVKITQRDYLDNTETETTVIERDW